MNFSSLFKRPAAPPEPLLDGAGLGLRDADLGGWFQNATGELFRGFPIHADDVVLDAGCGDGGNAAFCGRLGAHVILADIDAGCVEASRARVQGARKLEAFVSGCDPIPVPSATATKVVCTEVLEHVDDPARLMAELARVGQPGAQYLLTVPDPAIERLQQTLAPESYWRKPNHLRIIQRDEFAAMVEAAGLVIEHRGSYGFYNALWWLMFWSCDVPLETPHHPALENWERTWNALLDSKDGVRVKHALDEALPKSQLIIARKPA
jgi:SAM-dependent methyltransferase